MECCPTSSAPCNLLLLGSCTKIKEGRRILSSLSADRGGGGGLVRALPPGTCTCVSRSSHPAPDVRSRPSVRDLSSTIVFVKMYEYQPSFRFWATRVSVWAKLMLKTFKVFVCHRKNMTGALILFLLVARVSVWVLLMMLTFMILVHHRKKKCQ